MAKYVAYEMQGKRQIANFKEDRFGHMAAPQKWKSRRQLRVGNSEEHLALVRQLWCTLGTERYRIECHHLKSGPALKERGVGMKATDRWAVPLFYARHWDLENIGSRREFDFFMEHGINPYDLANALWANTGDLVRMSRVLKAHQEQARKAGRGP